MKKFLTAGYLCLVSSVVLAQVTIRGRGIVSVAATSAPPAAVYGYAWDVNSNATRFLSNSDTNATDGLIDDSYYAFTNSPGNTGTVDANYPSPVSYTNGISLNNDFDGVAEKIAVADADNLTAVSGANDLPLSLAAMVRVDDFVRRPIIGKYDSAAAQREYILFFNASGQLAAHSYDEDNNALVGRIYTTGLTAGIWYHILATYDGSKAASGWKLYVDGAQVDNSNDTSGSYSQMRNTTGKLHLGTLNTGTWYMDGSIDAARVYFNKELTAGNAVTNYWELVSGKNAETNNPGGFGMLPFHYDNKDNSFYTNALFIVNADHARAQDYSSHKRHGATGANDPSLYTVNAINGGYDFDGIAENVNMGSDAALDNMSAWTLCAWLNPDNEGGGSSGRIFDKRYNGSYQGWMLVFRAEYNQAVRIVIDRATQAYVRTSADNFLPTNTWTHFAMTVDTSSWVVKMYTNGIESASYLTTQTGSGAQRDDSARSFVIGDSSSHVQAYDGKQDEIWLYDKILTAAEIGEIYTNAVDEGRFP